jgi:hypothetical protein
MEKNVHSRPSTVRQDWVSDWQLSQAVATMRFQFSDIYHTNLKGHAYGT